MKSSKFFHNSLAPLNSGKANLTGFTLLNPAKREFRFALLNNAEGNLTGRGRNYLTGFTLIETIIGTFLVLIVFMGIFGAYQLSLKVIGQSKNKITATAIINQQIERIRNLPYESIGINAETAFPKGVLAAATTTIRNDVEYTIATKVKFIIDSADGISEACPNDYKKVEVKVSWSGMFGAEITATTDISPQNLAQECATHGGILGVSVFDVYGNMVPSPLIEIKDPSTNQTVNTAIPIDGKYNFALTTSTYKAVVSKPSYSTEQTYMSGEIYNGQTIVTPEKPHPIILKNQLTEISFSIDEVSAFSIDTLSPWGMDYFADSFDNTTKISGSSNITVSGGEADLTKTPGVYFLEGTTDENLCAFPGIDGDCGQGLTMGSQDRVISQIKLYLRKAAAAPSDIFLEVRSATTTGPVMASSTLIIGANLPINFEWISFTLQNSVNLLANSQYFLRLRSVPDSTDPSAGAAGPIHWGYASSSPSSYNGGEAFRYIGRNNEPLNSGENLEAVDFGFKIYDDEYLNSGYLISNAIFSAALNSWDKLTFNDLEPLNTDLRYQIYYASGTDWLLVPDSDLLGNSAGFDSSPVNLSGLATTTYSQLKIRANFSTADLNVSPSLYEWQVSWITTIAIPIPDVVFSVKGAKIVGLDAGDGPIYKYSTTTSSDLGGHKDLTNLEWDSYTFSITPATGLDLITTDPSPQPVNLSPKTTRSVILYLDAQNSFLLTLENATTLDPIFSATVRAYNVGLGYDKTQYTNEKGQTYFIPLEEADYNLEIQAPGYSATSTIISVLGDTTEILKLEQVE